jgi:hypothetical protein
MSAGSARLVAVPFVLLAFALRPAERLWAEPLTWRLESAVLGLIVALGFLAVSVAIPIGLYLLVTRPARRRPATWQLDRAGRRFVAPARSFGPFAVVAGWTAGGVILTERVPNRDRMRIATFGYGPVNSVALAVVLLAVVLVLLLLGRPVLALDPVTLVVRRVKRPVRIRWDELAHAGRRSTSRRGRDDLALFPEVGHRSRWTLPAGQLQIDAEFLAYTIRRYVDFPELRAVIGTDAELIALEAAFRSQRPGSGGRHSTAAASRPGTA